MADQDPSSQKPYYYPIRGKFIVRNISKDRNKTIRIFDYPILQGQTRDILRIPAIGESDIRDSLLKGVLRNKLIAKEIEIVDSDVDLLQFNKEQKAFLQAGGIQKGLEIAQEQLGSDISLPSDGGGGTSLLNYRQDITLLGAVNDVNRNFTIPTDPLNGTKTFMFDFTHKMLVYKNGVKQYYMDDYSVAESIPGGGYDTVIFAYPPETGPDTIKDIITADYYTPKV